MLITTSQPDALWCGVEVELYWCEASKRRNRYLYMRAHATRSTLIREQKNRGARVDAAADSEGDGWLAEFQFDEWVEEFTAWEAARRSPGRDVLTQPWSAAEVRVLEKLNKRQPYRPLVIWLEELAVRLPIQRGNRLYVIADRLCAIGKPEGVR